jgi:acyl-CoA synthetase (AMP-forming)/AMP-acid ligase II
LIGAVAVPVNARFRGAELSYVIGHADLVALLVTGSRNPVVDLVKRLHESLSDLAGQGDPSSLKLADAPRLRSIVMLGAGADRSVASQADFFERGRGLTQDVEHAREQVRERDLGIILYTSGTTSRPKGCMIPHEALVRNWQAVGARLAITFDDRIWIPCPMFHLAGIGPTLYTFDAGATILTAPHFHPDTALELIGGHRATVLYPAYPPITQAIVTDPRFRQLDISAARAMLNVAPPDTLSAMQAAIPDAVQVSLYGLTEASGAVSFGELSDDLRTRTETCGKPLAGTEVSVVDEDSGVPVPIGERGEIRVRGIGLAAGYYKDPVRSAEVIDEAGWLHTGDAGQLDVEGRLLFHGRIKDMLKVGGENVAPAEVENLLSTHPAVRLVQVVGVPHARLIEVPAALVELRPGAKASEDDLISFCHGRIASFKVPRHVRFVNDWPMSATKIQKAPLRAALIAELNSASA